MPSDQLTIKNLRRYLFIALVGLAPFSFTPSFALGTQGFVSFRIGLYQVLAAVFCLFMLPVIWEQRRDILKDRWLAGSVIVLAILAIISPLRSVNVTRSLLLTLSFGLLLALLLSAWVYAKTELTKAILKQAAVMLFAVATIVSVFAIGQFVAATFSGLDHVASLCSGCSASVFGFPRVNGFAAEPQFFANALLVPLIASFVMFMKKGRAQHAGLFMLFALTITLTLSRGGYAAAGFGIGIASLLLLINHAISPKRFFIAMIGGFVAFIVAIGLMVGSATIRHNQTPYIARNTFATVVEQLSAGRITIEQKTITPKSKTSSTSSTITTETTFKSPGVITASETDRETAASQAIKWWRQNLTTVLVGLGLGNLGSYAHQQNPAVYSLSFTVYIQYIFMLTELGLVGLAVFVALIWLGLKRTWQSARKQSWPAIILCGSLAAFALQYLFFGTYINVVYIWLYLGLGLGVTQAKRTFK